MSGGEPSSTKQSLRCAARVPALSSRYVCRIGAMFDFKVYGLISGPFGFLFLSVNEELPPSFYVLRTRKNPPPCRREA